MSSRKATAELNATLDALKLLKEAQAILLRAPQAREADPIIGMHGLETAIERYEFRARPLAFA